MKPNFLDRLVLFRHEIENVVALSKSLTVFHTKSETIPVILNFSYPGNVQYHKISKEELRGLEAELGQLSAVTNKATYPAQMRY